MTAEGDDAVESAPLVPRHYWTPEPVATSPAPGYVYVGFWRRTVALIIDGIILSIVSYAILIPAMLGALNAADLSLLGSPGAYYRDPASGVYLADPAVMAVVGRLLTRMFAALGVIFLLQAVYFVGLWAWRGATLGQLALGVEVRSENDGRRIGVGRALLRYIGFLISSSVLLLGFIWVAFDRRKQGWHDKIAGTLVVRRGT